LCSADDSVVPTSVVVGVSRLVLLNVSRHCADVYECTARVRVRVGVRVGVRTRVRVLLNVSRHCADVYECSASNDIPPAVKRHVKLTVECRLLVSSSSTLIIGLDIIFIFTA